MRNRATLKANEQSRKFRSMGFETMFRALAAPALVGVALAGQVAAQEPPPPPAAAAPILPAPLSPEAAAFRQAMQSGLAGKDARLAQAAETFYGSRDWQPYWSEPGSGRAAALAAALDRSGAQGLPRFETKDIVEAPAGSGAAAPEIAAIRAYVNYATDLQSGVVAPASVDPEIARRPVRPAPELLLARLGADPVEITLAELEPRDPDYAQLVAEKAALEALVRADAWGATVPGGPTLHEGESGPRIADLRARLGRMGYAAAAGPEGDARFDTSLAAAVRRFQSDHGLNDDGVAGARTIDAVNAAPELRLSQVLVNLERIRWMQRDPSERALRVNIPDFTVVLDDNGTAVWTSRVVVGETPETRTAEFDDTMTHMVVNPTWHIPDSIAIRTYLPKAQRDPGVFARNNIRLFTRAGTEINPRLVDFTQYTPDNFPFRIKQKPNDDNALGQVKFMFPNEFSIYMHDTSHRELFARDARAFSNGCIRLEKPVELAHVLLTGQVPDPAASYAAWREARKERTITFDRPIPVHIEYRTAFADETGTIRFRGDIYGRDAKVFRALEAAGVTVPAAQG